VLTLVPRAESAGCRAIGAGEKTRHIVKLSVQTADAMIFANDRDSRCLAGSRPRPRSRRRNTVRASFRHQFALHRTAETLNRLKDVATALTIAGGRFAALGIVGVFLHGASLAAATLVRDFSELARDWQRVAVAQELGDVALAVVRSRIVKSTNNWHLADVAGQGVLVSESGSSAVFFAERDQAAFLAFVRDQLWQTLGPSTRLAPTGMWADKVDVLAADAPTDALSEHADDIWARCLPIMEAGKTRSVLLVGPPGTGKSTVARALARRTVERFGGKVLRIAVADFNYLRPSVIEAAIRLLEPDVVLIDDLDRFAAVDTLLDMLEAIHARQKLLVATVNDAGKLPCAVTRPGRFDLRTAIYGVGPVLARRILGEHFERLTDAERALVVRWPAAFVRELADRVMHLPGADMGAEVRELAERADAQDPGSDPDPKGTESKKAAAARAG
jgi:energy-coupling factor transporter ATP-binding protein EcfA2